MRENAAVGDGEVSSFVPVTSTLGHVMPLISEAETVDVSRKYVQLIFQCLVEHFQPLCVLAICDNLVHLCAMCIMLHAVEVSAIGMSLPLRSFRN